MRGRAGGDEGGEVQLCKLCKLCKAWWATGGTWAFAVCEVRTMESSEQRRDMP